MVHDQIARRGIEDEAVLRAMRLVPRHRFVPHDLRYAAYDDAALAIGDGQTISQPYMVALMTAFLQLDEGTRLLEIGTGSGYQAAVASRICRQVWSVERHETLSQRAAEVLRELGYDNVRLFVGDGARGLPSEAPFEAIVVTAAAPQVPQPLLEQLADGGRLVAPLGGLDDVQTLMVYVRHGDAYERRTSVGCRFVPLVEGPVPAQQDDEEHDRGTAEDGDDRY
jgi:protein-L-isoaspartate(D-aspartate) O-methyltransferase